MTAVIDFLAAYRIVRLLQRDDLPLVRWLRDGVEARDDVVAELYVCPWCLGFWVSACVIAARRLAPRTWDTVSMVLAMSAVVGALRNAEETVWPD